MAVVLMENCEANYPRMLQYTYNIKEKFDTGINRKHNVYNKNMGKDIIFLKEKDANYQEIELYLKKIAEKFQKIQSDNKKLGGMPIIKNTRIPVSLIVACLKDEMTIEEICEEYRLTGNDIEEAMEYVIEVLDVPYQEG